MNVFRTKEIYKHIPYSAHNKNEIVPVRGVYVTGEYSPPYYNEPCILISQLTSQNATVDDFETDEYDVSDTQTSGVYNIEISASTYVLQRYERNSEDITPTQTAGVYNISATISQYILDRYEKDYDDITSTQTSGVYNIEIDQSTYVRTVFGTKYDSSTPEPILRITRISSGDCTITDMVGLFMNNPSPE